MICPNYFNKWKKKMKNLNQQTKKNRNKKMKNTAIATKLECMVKE